MEQGDIDADEKFVVGDDFLICGRPFPPPEDIHEDKNQFQPVWKQEVKVFRLSLICICLQH